MYDADELSCSNGGNVSVDVTHRAGSVPDGTAYDTYVQEVDSSDDGEFDHIITDLIPGNVRGAQSEQNVLYTLRPVD